MANSELRSIFHRKKGCKLSRSTFGAQNNDQSAIVVKYGEKKVTLIMPHFISLFSENTSEIIVLVLTFCISVGSLLWRKIQEGNIILVVISQPNINTSALFITNTCIPHVVNVK